MAYEDLLIKPPYALSPKDKDSLLLPALFECFNHHYKNCPEYKYNRLTLHRNIKVISLDFPSTMIPQCSFALLKIKFQIIAQ